MQHCREEYGLNWHNWIMIPVYLQCLFFVKVSFFNIRTKLWFPVGIMCQRQLQIQRNCIILLFFCVEIFFSYRHNLLQLKYAQWYPKTLKKCSETVCTSNKQWLVALWNFPKCPWMKLCCTRRNIKTLINYLSGLLPSIYINKTLFLHVCFHWDPETIKSFCGDTILYRFKTYVLDLYIVVLNTTLAYTTYSSMGFLNVNLEFHFFQATCIFYLH